MSTRLCVAVVLLIMTLAVLVLPLTGTPAEGKDSPEAAPHPKGYVCYRTPAAITIDGDLKDAAWDAAPWTDAFVDIEGDKKPKPRHRTRVKMLWDDDALYIAAELEEPHIWAKLKDHDAVIFHDNDFEVFLDPDGDNHVYGELELNALNTTWDLLLTKPYRDGGYAINAWEITGLKTAVKINGTLNDPRDKDTGWTLEIKWPWKSLQEMVHRKASPVPPEDGHQWRINFSRVEWDTEVVDGKYRTIPKRPEYNWVWSPQGAIDMHRPEHWGYLQFSTAKPGEARFKPDADWSIREALHRVHLAQKTYYLKNEKFAKALGDLGVKLPADRLSLETTRTGYELTWVEAGKPRYTITNDGRLSK